MNTYIIIAIVVIVVILIIYLWKFHKNFLFNLLLRTVFGITCMYLINAVSAELGLISLVGINEITVIVAASFGIPGLVLLYGGAIILKN